jgi:hypothetical protein
MSPSGLSDTSPDAEHVQSALLRQAGTARRFEMCREMTATVIALSRRALRRARPGLSEDELAIEWVAIHYGPTLADGLRRRLQEAG